MQQCQDMNLEQMTTTYEIIHKKRQLSCKGIARDLQIYGGLIVDLLLWKYLFLAGFVFWFMFSAIFKVVRYFLDRNILWAKFPNISGRICDLLRRIFGKISVFPVNHLSENWITAKRRDFSRQYSPSTKFYGFYLIDNKPSHVWVIF